MSRGVNNCDETEEVCNDGNFSEDWDSHYHGGRLLCRVNCVWNDSSSVELEFDVIENR